MSNTTTIEDLIERCVAAGVEARRVHAEVQAMRGEAIARHAMLTLEESARLAPLEAEAERLSRAYVAAQGPLYAVAPTQFQARLAEVCHRITIRLA